MNEQQEFWSGRNGDDWADKLTSFQSAYGSWEVDSGTTLKQLLQEYLGDVDRNKRILEPGCGPGWVIKELRKMGFKKTCGLDINKKAIFYARKLHGEDKDNWFLNTTIEILEEPNIYNLILTSAFLIHIHPDNLDDIMERIHNSSNRYIFGRELSSKEPLDCPIENPRKGKWENQYWTRRFKDKWLELYPDLKVVKYKLIPMMSKQYIQTEVYLLEK